MRVSRLYAQRFSHCSDPDNRPDKRNLNERSPLSLRFLGGGAAVTFIGAKLIERAHPPF